MNYFYSQSGILVLFNHFNNSSKELSLFISFINYRISTEETYSSKLLSSEIPSCDVNNNLLLSLINTYQQELHSLGNSHSTLASKLASVILPIQQFISQYKSLFSSKKDSIDALYKLLSIKSTELAQSLANYTQKCEASQAINKSTSQSDVSSNIPQLNILLQNFEMTVDEFNNTLLQMQQLVPIHDIKSFMITYKDCFSGSDAIDFLIKYQKLDITTATKFMTDLLSQSFIQSIAITSSKFSTTGMYKWKKMYLDTEPIHIRSKREADVADWEYKKSIIQCEKIRMSLDKECWEFIHDFEVAMKSKVSLMKSAFAQLIELEKSDFVIKEGISTKLNIFMESLDPDKELQLISEQDRTAFQRIPPFVYRNFFNGPTESIFGVSLQEYSRIHNKRVPSLVTKTLEYISKYFSLQIGVESQLTSWINSHIDLPGVRLLAEECKNGKVAHHLEKYPISVVIGMLYLYLQELPNSLCSFEIYEPLKLFYFSKTEDQGSMRLNSLRSLLATMNGCHFQTLLIFSRHLNEVILQAKIQDSQLNDLTVVLGPIICRPENETKLTLHDKHPTRLAKDLLVHFSDLFSNEMLTPFSSRGDLFNELVSPEESFVESTEDLNNFVFEGSRKLKPAVNISESSLDFIEGNTDQEITPTRKEEDLKSMDANFMDEIDQHLEQNSDNRNS